MADVLIHLRLAQQDAELGTPGQIQRRAVELALELGDKGGVRARKPLPNVAPRSAIAEVRVSLPPDAISALDARRGPYPRASLLLWLLREDTRKQHPRKVSEPSATSPDHPKATAPKPLPARWWDFPVPGS